MVGRGNPLYPCRIASEGLENDGIVVADLIRRHLSDVICNSIITSPPSGRLLPLIDPTGNLRIASFHITNGKMYPEIIP